MNKIICFLFLLTAVPLLGQEGAVIRSGRSVKEVSQKSLYNPWRLGGGLGLSFGDNDYLAIRVSPFVGYMITRRLEGGVSVGYQYSKRHSYKQNLFNFGPFLSYYPIPNIFTRVHYEYYTGSKTYRNSGNSYNFDENALWVGAGFRRPGRVQFYAGLMYNVLYKSDSEMFSNGFRPIIGVSFTL